MTGTQLKQIIAGCGISQKELAAAMPTIRHEQDWQRIFRSEDVKSGVIEQLAHAIGRTVGQLYGEQPAVSNVAYDHAHASVGSTFSCDPRLLDIIQARDRSIDRMHLQIERMQQQLTAAQQHADRLLALVELTPATHSCQQPAQEAADASSSRQTPENPK